MPDRHIDTAAVHAGAFQTPTNAGSSPPLFAASSYEFGDLEEVEAIYLGRQKGAIYGRMGGPNASQFEGAIAELEGTDAAVGAAAGMSAIDAALAVCVRPGDTLLASHELYGGTYVLLEKDYRERGVRVVTVDVHDVEGVRAAFERERPKALYVEALTNPLVRVPDLGALATVAHDHEALLIADATLATPALLRSAALGVDLVVHSVGKYLGGHGDVGAGVLAGRAKEVAAARSYLVRRGASLPHFDAWLAVRGLRTLALRMERHSSNAVAVAAALARDPRVVAVHHPSLPSHPQHALAARLYPRGTGGMLSIEFAGGAEAVDRFFRALDSIAIVHSLGEIATTVAYPIVSSHRPVPSDLRRTQGIADGLVRISVGIEHSGDIIRELSGALAGLGERVEA